MRNRLWQAVSLAVAVAATAGLAACGSNSSTPASSGSSPTSQPAASGSGIKTASTSLGTILTNSAGRTLYYFALDSSTKSACTGSCATYWPPVKGPVSAASGVSLSGTFGTITRSDGTTQATYDGHPLYTYAGDSAAGQTNGNGKNLSGGFWWALTPSGKKPGAAGSSPSGSPSSGGGGY